MDKTEHDEEGDRTGQEGKRKGDPSLHGRQYPVGVIDFRVSEVCSPSEFSTGE